MCFSVETEHSYERGGQREVTYVSVETEHGPEREAEKERERGRTEKSQEERQQSAVGGPGGRSSQATTGTSAHNKNKENGNKTCIREKEGGEEVDRNLFAFSLSPPSPPTPAYQSSAI